MRQDTIIDGFNLISPVYDAGADVLTLGLHRHFRNQFCSFFLKNTPRGGKILDVGCGTGDLLLRVAAQRPDVSSCGVDLSSGMLRLANLKLTKKTQVRTDKVEFKIGNAVSLAFEAHSFDTVTMCWSARSFKPLQVALREALRVLKPGGTLCILEHGLPEPELLRSFLNKYANAFPALGKKLLNSKLVYPLYVNSDKEFSNGKNFSAELFDAGFSKVTHTSHFGGLIYRYIAKKSK